jgi:hypothetical protein
MGFNAHAHMYNVRLDARSAHPKSIKIVFNSPSVNAFNSVKKRVEYGAVKPIAT